MKDIKITKEQAITVMSNILRESCSIPMASIGNGGAGLCFVSQSTLSDSMEFVSKLKDMSFRIVPTSEISDEFGGFHFSDDYDVCIEFSSMNGSNPYREQYLLWDIDHYKD